MDENTADDKPEEAKTDVQAESAAPQSARLEPAITSLAAAPTAKKKKKAAPAKRSIDDLSLIDIAGGVLLLSLCSLLLVNCYIAYLGKSYNERICAESIELAGKAVNDGLDTNKVILAAYDSYKDCAMPGFFVQHPEFTSFKDEITADLRVVTISTKTQVRLPGSFLILDQSVFDQNDSYEACRSITFNNTYQYRLSHPRGLENKKVLRDGKLVPINTLNGKKPAEQKPAEQKTTK